MTAKHDQWKKKRRVTLYDWKSIATDMMARGKTGRIDVAHHAPYKDEEEQQLGYDFMMLALDGWQEYFVIQKGPYEYSQNETYLVLQLKEEQPHAEQS